MQNLIQEIKREMVVAMKAKDQLRVETLRSITTALTVAEKSVNNKLTTDDVLYSLAKQRKQSILEFEKAGYLVEVEKEKAELLIIEEYLPVTLTDSELYVIINDLVKGMETAPTIRDMGKLLAQFKIAHPGQDMSKVSQIIKAALV